MSRISRYRVTTLLLAMTATLTLSVTPPSEGLPSTVASLAAQPVTVLAGRDYASSTFGDPWDYSNSSDLILDTAPTEHLTAASMSGGMLSFTTHSGYFSPIWGGYPMEVPTERVGTRAGNALDASTYTRLHMHIYVSAATGGVMSWYTCGAMRSACHGYMFFILKAGWNDLDQPIAQYKGSTGRAWTGPMVGLLVGLRVLNDPKRPTVPLRASVHLDSLRYYQPVSASAITWAAPGTSPASLWWTDLPGTITAVAGQHSGLVANATTSANSSARTTVNVAGYAPGTRFWSVAANGTKTLVGASAPAPLPVIDSPSAAGCGDYATRYLGHPWTFTSPRSMLWHNNMTKISYTKAGELSATNAPPVQVDPQLLLPLSAAGINGRVYHRMTIVESYEGPFNFSATPGGGAMGRVLWTTAGRIWAQTRPLVTFTGKRTLTFDLAMPALTLTDWSGPPSQRYAFAGTPPITRLRYDPNEDPAAKRWHLFSIRLAADCTAAPYFGVSWHDNQYSPGSTVRLAARAANGHTYPLGSATEHAGLNSRVVWFNSLPRGKYTVVINVTNRAHVTSTAVSTGPLVKP